MEIMDKIKDPWKTLISKNLLHIQAFTDSTTKLLAIFFTMDTRALNNLNSVDWICRNTLVMRLIAAKIFPATPIAIPNMMTLSINTFQIIRDTLLAPVSYDHLRKFRYPYHRATSLIPKSYQDQNIEWMIMRDKTPLKIKYKVLQDVALTVVPNIIGCSTDPILFALPAVVGESTEICPKGGILADEMGLGKTLCFLLMCIGTLPKEWEIGNKKLSSRSTLIILPNHLCGQWETEIKLIIKPHLGIKIVRLLSKANFKSRTLRDLLEADFVITSFQYILSATVSDPFETKGASPNTLQIQLDKYQKELYHDVRKHPKKLDEKGGISIFGINWHRICIDEIQEAVKHKYSPMPSFSRGIVLRTPNLSELLLLLMSERRWVLSGTPFAGIDPSQGYCGDFVNNPWAFNVGYVLAFVTNHRDSINTLMNIESLNEAKKLFRRNIRDHTKVEAELPPVEERIIRIPFSMQERILYSAYMADGTHGVEDEHLRMLCCHPDLASEVANLGSNNTKSVRKKLTNKYRKEYNEIREKVERCKRMQKSMADRLEKLGILVERVPDTDIDSSDSDSDSSSNSDGSDSDSSDSSNSSSDSDSSNSSSDSDSSNSSSDSDSSDDDIIREGNQLVDPKEGEEDEEEKRLKAEMTAEQLRQNLQTIQGNLREYRKQSEGKQRSLNFMKVVTKELGKKKTSCAICLDKVERTNIGLTMCGHIFCYGCIKASHAVNVNCPTCRTPLKLEDIHHVVDSKKKHGKNIQEWGSKLNYLIKFMHATRKKVLIFSQWPSLLVKVGIVLKNNGINNVFCKGNVFQKNKALVKFRTDPKTPALMMPTGTSAAGTNLVEAEYVIFLDPMVGKVGKATEAQAISRLCRMGQKAKKVKVLRLVIENTIEDEIVSAAKNAVVEGVPSFVQDEPERKL
jgi:SNF2 family DNA or RNA helicase